MKSIHAVQNSARFLRFKVPVGLFAFLCAAWAQADDRGRASIQFPPETRPNYKVEALSFHCKDEVGWDSPVFAPWISDEVIVGIQAPDAATISRIFGNVDSGDSRIFGHTESCILPIDGRSQSGGRVFVATSDTWTCSDTGIPGPFNFTVVMAEEDSGFFHVLHDCLGGGGWGCQFEPANTFPPGQLDDLIGRRTLEFTAEELAAAMPNINDTFEETITLGPCFDERGCVTSPGKPNDAEYTFTYRLTRLPGTFLGPILPGRP